MNQRTRTELPTTRCVNCHSVLFKQGGRWGDSDAPTSSGTPLVASMVCPAKDAPFLHVPEDRAS